MEVIGGRFAGRSSVWLERLSRRASRVRVPSSPPVFPAPFMSRDHARLAFTYWIKPGEIRFMSGLAPLQQLCHRVADAFLVPLDMLLM